MTVQSYIQRRTRRSGFSLIETLVAMVVLAIGILALISLFPPGLLTLQNTTSITIAQGIAQQQQALLQNSSLPPQAFLSALPNSNGTIQVVNGPRPDDLTPAASSELSGLVSAYGLTLPNLPSQFPLSLYSDINRTRYVLGEQFKVPAPSEAQSGAVYVLNYGPIYDQINITSAPFTDSLHVYSPTPLTGLSGQNISSANPAPALETNQYAIDYANGQIALYPRIGTGARLYLVRYLTLLASGGTALKFVSVSVTDVSNSSTPITAAWQPIPGVGSSIIPQSEQVFPQFQLVGYNGTTPNFDPNNPYQYTYPLNANKTGITLEPNNGNAGILLFNPAGHAPTLQNPQGLTAAVDYLIYNNHILRDDRAIPDQGQFSVQLTRGHVVMSGSPRIDGTHFNGLYSPDPADKTADSADIEVVNSNTGQVIAHLLGEKSVETYKNAELADLNAQSGLLTFNQQWVTDNNMQNTPIRIYYESHGGWGMDLQRSPSYLAFGPTVGGPEFGSYADVGPLSCWVGDGNNGSSPTRVYFPISESGKTVSLSSLQYQTAAGIFTAPNLTLTINSNPALYQNINGVLLTWADAVGQIADSNGNPVTALAVTPGVYLQGLSSRVQVVWRDPLLTSPVHWRHVEQDSVLTSAGY